MPSDPIFVHPHLSHPRLLFQSVDLSISLRISCPRLPTRSLVVHACPTCPIPSPAACPVLTCHLKSTAACPRRSHDLRSAAADLVRSVLIKTSPLLPILPVRHGRTGPNRARRTVRGVPRRSRSPTRPGQSGPG